MEVVAERQPKVGGKPRKRGVIRRYARQIAVVQGLALAGGGGLAFENRQGLQTARTRLTTVQEVNINFGHATDLLSVHTIGDRVIEGVTYRGETLLPNPQDATGVVLFAQRKLIDSGVKQGVGDAVEYLTTALRGIEAHAYQAGYGFSEEKKLIGDAGEKVVPQNVSRLRKKIQDSRANIERGIEIAGAIPALLILYGAVLLVKPTIELGKRAKDTVRKRFSKPKQEPTVSREPIYAKVLPNEVRESSIEEGLAREKRERSTK